MDFSAADLRAYNKKMQIERLKSKMGEMMRNRDITLTPRDFNYDNHHYQYLKYTKRAKVSPVFSSEAFDTVGSTRWSSDRSVVLRQYSEVSNTLGTFRINRQILITNTSRTR